MKDEQKRQLQNIKTSAKAVGSSAALPPTLKLAAALPAYGKGKPTKRKDMHDDVRFSSSSDLRQSCVLDYRILLISFPPHKVHDTGMLTCESCAVVQIKQASRQAGVSTASMGKFDERLPGEKPGERVSSSKRQKFDPVSGKPGTELKKVGCFSSNTSQLNL